MRPWVAAAGTVMLDDMTFLRAIAADPDDDGPRLVYADWLDERGDPASAARAEFIRVQCALAAAPTRDETTQSLRRRERDLLTEHWKAWLRPACQALGEPMPDAPASRSAGGDRVEPYRLNLFPDRKRHCHVIEHLEPFGTSYFHSTQFRRGFLAHAALIYKASRGERHVARLWDRVPLDGLTLIGYDPNAFSVTIAAIENGERLRSLEVGVTDDGCMEQIAGNPSLGALRELVLRNVVGRKDAAEVLGRSTTLRGLKTLILQRQSVDPEGLATLARSPVGARLQRLEVIECGLTDAGAAQLARHYPREGRLTRLEISTNRLRPEGWKTLEDRFGGLLTRRTGEWPWPARFYL